MVYRGKCVPLSFVSRAPPGRNVPDKKWKLFEDALVVRVDVDWSEKLYFCQSSRVSHFNFNIYIQDSNLSCHNPISFLALSPLHSFPDLTLLW